MLLSCSLFLLLISDPAYAWTTPPASAYHQDHLLARDLGILWICIAAAYFIGNLVHHYWSSRYIRQTTISARPSANARPNPLLAFLKRHFLSAPLFIRRHSKPFTFGRLLSFGSLATRPETLLIAGYFLINITLALVHIQWHAKSYTVTLTEFRNRTGTLAVVNTIPLVIFAGRNNFLISLLSIPFNTFNLLHRWIGRTVVALAICHGATQIYMVITASGSSVLSHLIAHTPLFTAGMIALIALCLILIFSIAPIRAKFYETFLHLHQALAVLVFAMIWWHLDQAKVWQRGMIIATVALWAAERAARLARLLIININPFAGAGHRITSCDLDVLPGDAVRVTVRLARPWTVKAGQHAYLYIPSIGLHTSHPFSVAWSEEAPQATSALPVLEDSDTRLQRDSSWSGISASSSGNDHEKIDSERDIEKADQLTALPQVSSGPAGTTPLHTRSRPVSSRSTLSFIIRKRTGFTSHLHKRAASRLTHQVISGVPAKDTPIAHLRNLTAFVEGPYGNDEQLNAYDNVVLVAGGIGITHCLIHLRSLLSQMHTKRTAARKVTLFWAVQFAEQIEWATREIGELLSSAGSADIEVKIFVSRSGAAGVDNAGVALGKRAAIIRRKFAAREIASVVREEPRKSVVCVCGPGALNDDVRYVTRGLMSERDVRFVESNFMW